MEMQHLVRIDHHRTLHSIQQSCRRNKEDHMYVKYLLMRCVKFWMEFDHFFAASMIHKFVYQFMYSILTRR